MRFAEVFLRLGSALVAWLMMYAYFLWLSVVYVVGCGPDGDEMHRLLIGMAPFVCGFAFALRATRPISEIHSILRWAGVPLLLLLPFTLRSIWQVFQMVNLDGSAICATGEPRTWQVLWAPAQLFTLVLVMYLAVNVWRSVKRDKTDAEDG